MLRKKRFAEMQQVLDVVEEAVLHLVLAEKSLSGSRETQKFHISKHHGLYLVCDVDTRLNKPLSIGGLSQFIDGFSLDQFWGLFLKLLQKRSRIGAEPAPSVYNSVFHHVFRQQAENYIQMAKIGFMYADPSPKNCMLTSKVPKPADGVSWKTVIKNLIQKYETDEDVKFEELLHLYDVIVKHMYVVAIDPGAVVGGAGTRMRKLETDAADVLGGLMKISPGGKI